MYLRLIVRLSCRVYLCVFFVLFSVYLYALYLLLQYGKLLAVTGHLSTHTTGSLKPFSITMQMYN